MKNIVRAFVLTLAVASMTATTVSKASTPSKTAVSAMTEPGSPTPVCKPSDPSLCGID